jgi:hypothetical protein
MRLPARRGCYRRGMRFMIVAVAGLAIGVVVRFGTSIER